MPEQFSSSDREYMTRAIAAASPAIALPVRAESSPLGSLQPDPDRIIDLPAGFSSYWTGKSPQNPEMNKCRTLKTYTQRAATLFIMQLLALVKPWPGAAIAAAIGGPARPQGLPVSLAQQSVQ